MPKNQSTKKSREKAQDIEAVKVKKKRGRHVAPCKPPVPLGASPVSPAAATSGLSPVIKKAHHLDIITSRFHHNGKKPKPKMLSCLCFTTVPYGFKETMIEESVLKAAGITPLQDEIGDIYLVVKKKDESDNEVLSRWPGSINFPAVSSEELGMALDWPEIRYIDKTRKAPWLKQLSGAVWAIIIGVLILIFFLGYFFLTGGGK